MPIKHINPDDYPEEYASLKKSKECRRLGHGKLVVGTEGFAWCEDCGDSVLDDPDCEPEGCEKRGHGEVIVGSDGSAWCYICGAIVLDDPDSEIEECDEDDDESLTAE